MRSKNANTILIAKIVAFVVLLIIVVETIEQMVFPGGFWSSHIFAVSFASIISTTAAYMAIKELTIRKNVQHELEKEKGFAESVLDTTQAMVLVLDTEGNIVQINPYQAWEHFCLENKPTFMQEVRVGVNYLDIYREVYQASDEVAQVALSEIKSVLAGKLDKYEQDFPCHTKSGQKWFRFIATPLQHPMGGAVITCLDITSRKKLEFQLIESNHRFELFLENLPSSIYIKDLDGNHVLVNRRFEEITNILSKEAIGKKDEELFGVVVAEIFGATDREVLDTGKCLQSEDIIQQEDGEHYFITNKFPLFDGSGKLFGVGGISTDITEVKQAQEAHRDSEEQLRLITDALPSLVAYLDPDGSYRYVNKSYEKWFEVSQSSLIGTRARDLMGEEAFAKVEKYLERALQGQQVAFESDMPFRLGGERYVSAVFVPQFDAKGNIKGIISLVHDITKIKRAEEDRVTRERAQKETLVREVHHRIKNNLQSVAGLLRRQGDSHEAIKPFLEEAISQVSTIAIVHGLQGENAGDPLGLHDMLTRILKAALEIIPLSKSPVLQASEDVFAVLNPEESVPIALVLNELITNALKYRQVEMEQPVQVSLGRNKSTIIIAIRNRASRLPKNFDLDAGYGLGLGLKLVKALLPENGANLVIDEDEAGVSSILELSPPVIMSGSAPNMQPVSAEMN